MSKTRIEAPGQAPSIRHFDFAQWLLRMSGVGDFACRDPMLVIELDGDSHGSSQAHDARRTAYLETQGYRVIRFTNAEVMGNLDGVLAVIAGALGRPFE